MEDPQWKWGLCLKRFLRYPVIKHSVTNYSATEYVIMAIPYFCCNCMWENYFKNNIEYWRDSRWLRWDSYLICMFTHLAVTWVHVQPWFTCASAGSASTPTTLIKTVHISWSDNICWCWWIWMNCQLVIGKLFIIDCKCLNNIFVLKRKWLSKWLSKEREEKKDERASWFKFCFSFNMNQPSTTTSTSDDTLTCKNQHTYCK